MELYQLKEYVNVAQDDYAYDALLNSMYISAKSTFTGLTDVYLSKTTEVFTYTNFSNNYLYLKVYPINEIDKIEYKSSFSDSSYTELETTKYELDYTAIRFDTSYAFYKLKVTADFGYEVIPENIDFLLAQIVHYYFSFQALDVHLSSKGSVPLMPSEATLPKFLYDNIKLYKKFL